MVPQIVKLLNKMISPDMILIFSFVIVAGLTYLVALVAKKYIEERGISFGKHLIDADSRKKRRERSLIQEHPPGTSHHFEEI